MSHALQIGSICAVAAGVAALAIWSSRRKSVTPEKREQRRRAALHATGRLGDAMISEVAEDTLFYTYSVRGVQYAASQDISSLRDRLPLELERLIGPAGIKYSAGNPANSMLVSEEWSGLRAYTPRGAESANADTVGHQPQDTALTERAQR